MESIKNSEYWVKKLHLQPHPEGGFFKETYRSEEYFAEVNAFSDRFFFLISSQSFLFIPFYLGQFPS